MNDNKQDGAKKPNGFVAFLKRAVVHNFGWKVLSVVAAAVIWALAAGLM